MRKKTEEFASLHRVEIAKHYKLHEIQEKLNQVLKRQIELYKEREGQLIQVLRLSDKAHALDKVLSGEVLSETETSTSLDSDVYVTHEIVNTSSVSTEMLYCCIIALYHWREKQLKVSKEQVPFDFATLISEYGAINKKTVPVIIDVLLEESNDRRTTFVNLIKEI